MGIPRFNAKRDANELGIISALQACGASVTRLSAWRLPDLLVGYRSNNYLIEVKTITGRLTPDQVEFITEHKGTVHVVTNIKEALDVLMKNN